MFNLLTITALIACISFTAGLLQQIAMVLLMAKVITLTTRLK